MPPGTTTSRASAYFSACVTLLTIAGCSGSPETTSPKQSEKSEKIELVSLDNETCEGIFDKETIEEAENEHDMREVHLPRTDSSFFTNAAIRMTEKMATFKPDMSGCGIYDSGKREILLVETNWGPEIFPEHPSHAGVSYSTEPGNGERFQLLIDCQRPDLAAERKANEMLAARVSLTDHTGFSDRARASLLNNTAKAITSNLDCTNEVSYPAPETVKFD